MSVQSLSGKELTKPANIRGLALSQLCWESSAFFLPFLLAKPPVPAWADSPQLTLAVNSSPPKSQ